MEVAQIRKVTVETHPRPKPELLEPSWCRHRKGDREGPGQEGALEEDMLGETQCQKALEETAGHKCQGVSKRRGQDQRGLGQMSLPDRGCLEQLGLGRGGSACMGMGSRVCREQGASGKAGYPSLSCTPNPTDGVSQDLLSGSLGKSWAGVTQSP